MTPSPESLPSSVHIPGTKRHELRSQRTGRVYDISIGLPTGHEDAEGPVPSIYVLDGQCDFKLVLSIYGGLRYDMFVPDAIVVGIAAGGDNPDHDALRTRDYTSTAHKSFAGSGKADEFHAFLSEELMPFVEQRYRADPADRTLVGSSLGGLFALRALFTQPDLFNRFVVVSPAIVREEQTLIAYEEQLAQYRRQLAVRLFLAAGELEPTEAFLFPLEQMADRLRSRKYRGLRLIDTVVAGERHAGVKAEAFNRGLRWVFTKPALNLPADELLSYVGKYRQDVDEDGRHPSQLLLRVEGDRLIVDAEPGMHDGDELVPVATDEFVFIGRIPGEAAFHRDANGVVDRLSIRLAEQTIELARVH